VSSKGRTFTCDGCKTEVESDDAQSVPSGWQHLEIISTRRPTGSLSGKERWWRNPPHHADVCSASCAATVASVAFEARGP
jgi:hypothetical protein